MKVLLTFTLLVALLSLSFADSGSYFSPKDAKTFKTLILSQQKDGNFGDAHATLDALLALSHLQALPSETSKLCDFGAQALSGDIKSIAAGLEIRSILKCLASKTPESAMNKIEQALEKSSDPVAQLFALLASGSLSGKGITKSLISSAVEDVLTHMSSDGFKEEDEADSGSAFYTGLLLESLADLHGSLSKEQRGEVTEEVVDAVKGFLSSGGESDDKTLIYQHSDATINEYQSTSALLKGIALFNRAYSTKIAISDANVNKLAHFLLSHTSTSSPDVASDLINSLYHLNSGTWRKPIIVSASQTVLKTLAKGEDSFVRFQITDLFGTPALQNPKVFLASAYSSDSATPFITNQELSSSTASAGFYDFNLLATKPAPGSYKLILSVTPSKEESSTWATIKSTSRTVKVISSIELSDLTFTVSTSKDEIDTVSKHTYSYQQQKGDDQKEGKAIAVNVDQHHLIFTFGVKNKATNKPIAVQQAFIMLLPSIDSQSKQNKKSSESEEEDLDPIYFVAKFDAQKKVYQLHVQLSKYSTQIGSLLGSLDSKKFNLKLLIGDSFIDNSIQWDFATLNIKTSQKKSDGGDGNKKEEKKPELEHRHQGVSSYKPQIFHKFRPADKRADTSISYAFTLLTLAPLGIFILGLPFVGLNFGACPSGMGMLWALGFQASVAAIGYVLFLFFWQNNLFQTLMLLVYLAPPTIFFGHRTLRAVYLARSAKSPAQSD